MSIVYFNEKGWKVKAVALACFVTERLHGHLCLLASLEIIENRSYYNTDHIGIMFI